MPADDLPEEPAQQPLAFVAVSSRSGRVEVQRDLNSGSYAPGRLNPLRENALHHFYELLRRAYREHQAP